MVIGFDAKRAFRNNTGLGNYSRILLCSLATLQDDIECILYSPKMSGEYTKFFSSYAKISTRQPSGIYRWFPNTWRSIGISRLMRDDRIEIYHGLSHELPHLLSRRIYRVVTIHDLVAWRYPQYFSTIDAIIHRIKMKHACKTSDIVVAISEQTKRDLIEFAHVPEEKIRVLYQSCDEQFWMPIAAERVETVRNTYNLPEKYLITIGTVEERKNQLAIVEAMQRLPDDIHLVIIGRPKGKYGKSVQKAITESRTTHRIHWIHNADFEDFPALYAGSIASVYVSRFEGFGIPILESMCSGTAVLTSNCSSMPEVGGDAVLYANPDDLDEIAHQMQRLVEDSQLRNELIARGRERIQLFSAQHISDQYRQLYKELMQNRKR